MVRVKPVAQADAATAGAARLEPISISRSFMRRPMREWTVLRIAPVAVRIQKTSRPRMRWGSGVWREPTERWTSCVAESSSAIW